MKYREKQISAFIIIILFIVEFLIFSSYFFQWGNKPLDTLTFSILSIFLIIILLLFYKMETFIDKDFIQIFFGIGIIRKKIEIRNIKNLEVVKNRWYYGWGIRLIKNGLLYNIKGFNAIELKFKNRKSIIRIGTQDTEKLKSEIEKNMYL